MKVPVFFSGTLLFFSKKKLGVKVASVGDEMMRWKGVN